MECAPPLRPFCSFTFLETLLFHLYFKSHFLSFPPKWKIWDETALQQRIIKMTVKIVILGPKAPTISKKFLDPNCVDREIFSALEMKVSFILHGGTKAPATKNTQGPTDAYSVTEYEHVLCHTVLVDRFRSSFLICCFIDHEHSWRPSSYQQC